MLRALRPVLALPLVVGSLVAAACGGGSGPPPDFRGDPLCDNAQASETGGACGLSVSLQGHTYMLSCDLSQGTCECFRDGGRTSGSYGFGGSATPTCTADYLHFEWSDCCGTPE